MKINITKTEKPKSLRPIMEIREFTCKVAVKPESDYMRSLKKTSPHSTARTAASEIELE